MDSSVSPTHGEQEGTAYNGHFVCTCYHPLFMFNQFGESSSTSCEGSTWGIPSHCSLASTAHCRTGTLII
jgi:hypothetical protein